MHTDTVDLKRLGRIDIQDLTIINEYLGREFLPFPLIPTLPNRFTYFDEYAAHARSVPDRFNHGDLVVFKKWFTSLAEADLRVECRVQYYAADIPAQRMLAHRTGQLGFLALQGADDVVDVFTLSPYDLGPAIAGSVDMTRPGARPAVVISEYVPQTVLDVADESGADQPWAAASPVTVSSAEVRAYATVQSHRLPARDWGVDQERNAVVFVGLVDDGDYAYVPGYSCAKPVSRQDLRQRIDQLIADDVAVLRQSRDL